MSSIKVWTSDGDWSEAVEGCDKVHLMKKAIACECSIAKDNCKGKKELCRDLFVGVKEEDGSITEKVFHMSCLQIDNKAIDVAELMDEEWKIEYNKLNFNKACFFKMRLSALRKMAEEEKTISAVYNKLIDLAKVSEKSYKDYYYCLFFMFDNE